MFSPDKRLGHERPSPISVPLEFRRQRASYSVLELLFGLSNIKDVSKLIRWNEPVGEVRIHNEPSLPARIEIIDSAETSRVGLPSGFLVEISGDTLRSKLRDILPLVENAPLQLEILHRFIEDCRVSTEGIYGGIQITRCVPACVKEPTAHKINSREEYVEYVDNLPASLADWCHGSERREKRLLRRESESGTPLAEANLLINSFPDGSSVAEFRVLRFSGGSWVGEQVLVRKVTARSEELSESVAQHLEHLYHQLEQHSLEEALAEIAPRSVRHSHSLRANSVNLSATLEHDVPRTERVAQKFARKGELHLVSGGIVTWDASASPETVTIKSAAGEGASKIDYVYAAQKGSTDSFVSLLSLASEGTLRACKEFLDQSKDRLSVRMVSLDCRNKREVSQMLDRVSPFSRTLQPANFPIEKNLPFLEDAVVCGHDWFGFTDLRFGRETVNHGARYAYSIFFQGWSGGIHRIALQMLGGSLVLISPGDPLKRDTAVLSSERSFVRGDIGLVRDFVFDQLFLFNQDPLRLLQHHVVNGSVVTGGLHNVYSNTGLSQAQFLSQMLIIDNESRRSRGLFLTSELHELLVGVGASQDSVMLPISSNGGVDVLAEFTSRGLGAVHLTKSQGIIKQAVSGRRRGVVSSDYIPPAIGDYPERSHALVVSIIDSLHTMSGKEIRSRSLKNLVRERVAEQLASIH